MRRFTLEFNKKLKADFGDVDFLFEFRIIGRAESRIRQYVVSVNDNEHNSQIFRMRPKSGKWVIVEKKVPEWIVKLKDELSNAIIEHRGKYI
jgi:hypothetical protein